MKIPPLERIMRHVLPEPNSGCWLWAGSVNVHGYGTVNFRQRSALAHRAVWILIKGEPPVGLELDHKCRVRCCVNPDHLEWVTHEENVRRGCRAEMQRAVMQCPKGHPYGVGKPGHYRKCLPCEAERKRAQRRASGKTPRPWQKPRIRRDAAGRIPDGVSAYRKKDKNA
jgi:hypothetical protein